MIVHIDRLVIGIVVPEGLTLPSLPFRYFRSTLSEPSLLQSHRWFYAPLLWTPRVQENPTKLARKTMKSISAAADVTSVTLLANEVGNQDR